jgi:hypothetical protein
MTGRQGITYFDRPGKQNTDTVIEVARRRLVAGDIGYVIVATSSGRTAEEMAEAVRGMSVKIVAVTLHCGFSKEGVSRLSGKAEERLRSRDVAIVRSSHALSGVERSISGKLGGASRVEVISETLRSLLGHGFKVCVECTIMAADSGAIPCGDEEVMVIGGQSQGADTACVVRPAHSNNFFKLEVRELLAMPRAKVGRDE